jgi:hypothetical protein
MFLFLMNFFKVVTKKTCHTTYAKALLVKKMDPSCHISRKKCLSSAYLYIKKWCHAIHTKVFMGKRWCQVAILGGENLLISDI